MFVREIKLAFFECTQLSILLASLHWFAEFQGDGNNCLHFVDEETKTQRCYLPEFFAGVVESKSKPKAGSLYILQSCFFGSDKINDPFKNKLKLFCS